MCNFGPPARAVEQTFPRLYANSSVTGETGNGKRPGFSGFWSVPTPTCTTGDLPADLSQMYATPRGLRQAQCPQQASLCDRPCPPCPSTYTSRIRPGESLPEPLLRVAASPLSFPELSQPPSCFPLPLRGAYPPYRCFTCACTCACRRGVVGSVFHNMNYCCKRCGAKHTLSIQL